GDRAASTRIPGGSPRVALHLAVRFEALLTAEAVIDDSSGQQLREVPMVELPPLGLAVGTRFSHFDAFVPIQAQPFQLLLDGGLELRPRALSIGVLNPQDERPPQMPCEQPVEECRARVAHMEGARGGGSEPRSDAQRRA